MLPAGVVFTGAGAKLKGTVEVAKRKLRLPASLGLPVGVTAITDRVQDLGFSTAIGLVLWGAAFSDDGGKGKKISRLVKSLGNLGGVKKFAHKLFGDLFPR